MTLNELKARNTKADKKPSLSGYVSQEGEDIIIRIKGAVSMDAVKASNTDKAVPMVTVVPRKANGEMGVPYVSISVTEGEATGQIQGRIGTFNLFL